MLNRMSTGGKKREAEQVHVDLDLDRREQVTDNEIRRVGLTDGNHSDRRKVVHHVPADHDQRQDETDPEESTPREGGQERTPPGLLDHLRKDLGQRKTQFFMDDPLFTQDHHQTGSREEQGDKERAPPEQRDDPGPPWEMRIRGQPLVEPPDRMVFRGHQQPLRQVLKENFYPLVFGRRKIVRSGDDPDEIAHESVRRHSGRDQAQGQDDKQFRSAEGGGWSELAQESVHDDDEEEERRHQGRGDVLEVHESPPYYPDVVRDP